ncbi:MAG TPA: polysaccharide deacetylase family protein [Tepidisphaeraceae bacterium]|jgi:peptidoglycan/xylan/chitin deacetylase (PgdA/CDA1 family)|nr:polysaccharide deacetylase family protein [Tepidisphaeraceae bacterium]
MTPRIEIPNFPGGKRIAFTTSWDDGVVEDRRVVAALNDMGMKGTFNLNSGTLGRTGERLTEDSGGRLDASEVAELYAGHEVAIHTVTHPHLPRLDASQMAAEVLDDRRALEDLVGYPVRGMAYPFGTYNAQVIDVLRALGIVYARTCENRDPCFPPAEPLAWGSTAHHFHPDVPERWKALHGSPNRSGVFFIWAHSYEFQRQNRWDDLERIYRPMAGHDDVWYCTNIELFDYHAARERIVIAANRQSAYNPSAVPVTLKVGNRLLDIPPGIVTPLME